MSIGPVVQQDLASILIRFRTFKYVLVADIIKMYRQIAIHPSQTRYQKIFWRDNPDSNLEVYELTTLTYGTSAASYLATRCLKHLADLCADSHPIGSLHLNRDFYVDDLSTGANTLSEAISIRNQVIQLLELGSFKLSKWGSNCPALLEGVSDQEEAPLPFDKNGDSRVLGVLWDKSDDAFQFLCEPSHLSEHSTKRSILSDVSKLFDPLGLLGPIMVIAKLIIQDLWQSGVGWDESIPQTTYTSWLQLKLQLPTLSQLRIPRCAGTLANPDMVQIHGFYDASQRACIYIRSKVAGQDYQLNLLCSKSRVAPLKTVSLPRLELSAALLLAQLFDKLKSSLDLAGVRVFLWSDSTITLSWIISSSRRWTVFVANRVGEIQRLTDPENWRHVTSRNNPADILSRGLLPNELIDSSLWWHGPSFLSKPECEWPGGEFNINQDELPEQKRVSVAVTLTDRNIVGDLLNKFSNLNKACRILAYCLRIFTSLRSRFSTLAISAEEISNSLHVMCRVVQAREFASEYDALSNRSEVNSASILLSLSPFMGDDKLIRVGGRIKNSALSFDACHQILLPRNHVLSRRIIEFEHLHNVHSGLQATMAAVRQRFWPLSLQSITRKIIRDCMICFKAKPIFSEALMGSLPTPRVNCSRPFSHCGIDYAGPVNVKEGRRRNSRIHKAYIAVFVCFATKAVHLELVSDLTTNAFIAALKRLISRRGKPQRMYSDNATTFVGAQGNIKQLYDFLRTDQAQKSITDFLCDQ